MVYICVVLDVEGFIDMIFFVYVVKYVSVFYGFFCEVVDL